MEIYNTQYEIKLFSILKIGNVIRYKDSYYLKVVPFKVGNIYCNVVCLENGDYGHINENDLVHWIYRGTFC